MSELALWLEEEFEIRFEDLAKIPREELIQYEIMFMEAMAE